MVGISGLEPPTSRLSGVRSNRLSYTPSAIFSYISVTLRTLRALYAFSFKGFHLLFIRILKSRLGLVGGDKRDRTVDPLLAKQVLSQLSYTPIKSNLMKI